MRESKFAGNAIRRSAVLALTVGLVALSLGGLAWGESLFRTSATYNRNLQPYTPPSLITQPAPSHVGDIVTIIIEDEMEMATSAQLQVTREQMIDENGTGLLNSMIDFVVRKFQFADWKQDKVVNKLSVPSFNGLNNSNELTSGAESTRRTELTGQIACQVVQILPNGNMIVQGRKVVAINNERQDMYVTGIVNPYYLDRQNRIASNLVGNFQLVQAGEGVISRRQRDGFANRIFQFFN